MIKQTDKRLNAKINSFGCWFLSHLAMISMNWTAKEVEDVYQLCLKAGAIDANCTGLKPNEVLAIAAQYKKESPTKQLGGLVYQPADSWGVKVPDAKVKFIVVKWTTQNEHFHFTLHVKKGEIYDPFDPVDATYSLHKMQRVSEQYYG